MTTWTGMRRQDIDAGEPLTLFDITDMPVSPGRLAEPDKYGTPGLFSTEEE